MKWGFNFVRLGVMWEAVEVSVGVYDTNYLDNVNILVNQLGEAGIYTLIDVHQDLWARTNCGEGMPNFYARRVLPDEPHCFGPILDKFLKPILNTFGLCKSILHDYGYRIDPETGDPLIEDC